MYQLITVLAFSSRSEGLLSLAWKDGEYYIPQGNQWHIDYILLKNDFNILSHLHKKFRMSICYLNGLSDLYIWDLMLNSWSLKIKLKKTYGIVQIGIIIFFFFYNCSCFRYISFEIFQHATYRVCIVLFGCMILSIREQTSNTICILYIDIWRCLIHCYCFIFTTRKQWILLLSGSLHVNVEYFFQEGCWEWFSRIWRLIGPWKWGSGGSYWGSGDCSHSACVAW